MSDTIRVRVRNFDKFMARKDIKEPWWFKLSNKVLEDPEVYQLTAEEFRAFVYVLCAASKKKKSETTLMKIHAENSSRIAWSAMITMLDKMVSFQILDIIESGHDPTMIRPQSDRDPTSRLEEKRRDKKREEGPDSTKVDPASWLMLLWNQSCGALPKCKGLNKSRIAKIHQRLKDQPDHKTWATAIVKLSQSRFCNGDNDRGWKAGFDFLLQPESLLKILEGKYDNTEKKKSVAINWDFEAEIVFEAIRKHGSQTIKAKEFLGDERWNRVRAIGGLHRIGQMPANDYSTRKLAGLLRAASESNNQPSKQGVQNERQSRSGRTDSGIGIGGNELQDSDGSESFTQGASRNEDSNSTGRIESVEKVGN